MVSERLGSLSGHGRDLSLAALAAFPPLLAFLMRPPSAQEAGMECHCSPAGLHRLATATHDR